MIIMMMLGNPLLLPSLLPSHLCSYPSICYHIIILRSSIIILIIIRVRVRVRCHSIKREGLGILVPIS